MKYKPYPNYKDSGIKWIGEIPEGWKILPIKGICELGRGRVISNEEIGENEGAYPVYSSQTINNGEMGRTNTYNFSGEYVTWTTDGANAGTAFYRNEKFNCTNVCGTLKKRNNRIYMKLLPYILNHITKYYVRYDINPKLMNDMMARIEIFLSPLTEQIVIANFLDKKIARIDALIEKDKKLIALLKEKRAALINNSVTKGLDPNANMKDSGTEWIGEIPEGWEIKKLKFVSDVYISNVDKKIHSNEDSVLLCNYIDVYKNEFITSNLDFMKATANIAQIKKLSINKNDVIITKDSETIEEIAIPALVSEDLKNIVCGYHLSIVRSYKEELIGQYLFRLFQSKKFSERFSINANGVTRFGISTYPIKNILILIPSKQEQIAIAEYLDKNTLKIDKTIHKIQRKIKLLEEYKKSLIHHTVTGKVDVREVKV